MKKFGAKHVLLSIVGILCIVAILNLNKIKFLLNMFISYSKVNNENYEDLTNVDDDLVVKENPLLSIVDETDDRENIISDSSIIDDNPNSNETKNNDDNDNSISKVKHKSYKSIISDFNNKFELLQKDYEAKLNNLVKSGYDEYTSGKVSKTKLATKYINEGSRLEKECDGNFNNMLKEMEKELETNGHDISIVKDLKEYYNSYKETRRSQLIGKAKGYMD